MRDGRWTRVSMGLVKTGALNRVTFFCGMKSWNFEICHSLLAKYFKVGLF